MHSFFVLWVITKLYVLYSVLLTFTAFVQICTITTAFRPISRSSNPNMHA